MGYSGGFKPVTVCLVFKRVWFCPIVAGPSEELSREMEITWNSKRLIVPLLDYDGYNFGGPVKRWTHEWWWYRFDKQMQTMPARTQSLDVMWLTSDGKMWGKRWSFSFYYSHNHPVLFFSYTDSTIFSVHQGDCVGLWRDCTVAAYEKCDLLSNVYRTGKRKIRDFFVF